MSELTEFVNIEAARSEFGETEYAYFRMPVTFSSGRKRGAEKHFMGAEIEVTKEEYEAKVEQGKKDHFQQFTLGSAKFRQDFSVYSRKVSKPGWRERLIEMLQATGKAVGHA